MLSEEFLPVKLVDVSITNVGFAIFLQPTQLQDSVVVPIFIGPLETHSISTALDGIQPPRPSTHDLVINMLRELDAQMVHILISDIIGSVFYARIVIQLGKDMVELDSRPSDAIAIAIRAKCPIYMHEKVYQKGSINLSKKETPQVAPIEDIIDVENETDVLQKLMDLGKKELRTGSLKSKKINSISKEQHLKNRLEQLSKELNQAIELEDFEKAVVIRDSIRSTQDKWQEALENQALESQKQSQAIPNPKLQESNSLQDTPIKQHQEEDKKIEDKKITKEKTTKNSNAELQDISQQKPKNTPKNINNKKTNNAGNQPNNLPSVTPKSQDKKPKDIHPDDKMKENKGKPEQDPEQK